MIWKFNGTTSRFGWDSPLTVEEEEGGEVEGEVEQDFFPRYSNPWSQTEWGSKVIRWELGSSFKLSELSLYLLSSKIASVGFWNTWDDDVILMIDLS